MPETRGRKRGFDVDAAVDAATKLFHARGYDAVGVAELVAFLGIKPPSFYAAFGSKAGLFERALQRYSASEANLFAQALAQGGDVATVIERLLRLAATTYPNRDGVAGCLVLDGARNSADEDAKALVAAAKRASRHALRDYIATATPTAADRLADFVVIAIAGMSAAARDGADGATLQGFADIAIRAFHQELSAPPTALKTPPLVTGGLDG